MHPLHAHLHAMDGSRAYLARLVEFEAEYRAMHTPQGRASVRALYTRVLGRFLRNYPHLKPPPTPACLLHR